MLSGYGKKVPAEEISKRISSFQEMLVRDGMDGALIVQSADLVYFTGIFQSSFLYIPAQGEPLLMVRRSFKAAKEVSPLERIIPVKSVKQVPGMIQEYGYGRIDSLGIEMDVIPAVMYFNLQKTFSGVKLLDCSTQIRQLRAVKSTYELELLQDACATADRVFSSIPDFLHPGKKEVEVAAELEARFRKEEHQGLVRMRGLNIQDFHYGLVVSGPSGGISSYFDGPLGGPGLCPAFPFGTGNRLIQRNEVILIDYATCKNGYIIDMTRVHVIGKMPENLYKAHQVALEIQQDVVEAAKPGVLGNDLYNLAYGIASKYNLQGNFMGCDDQVAFVAHGVGLELNEFPIFARGLKMPLEEGMVVALEPKFAFPGEGAVGIENTFVVTANGLKRFSNYPDEIVIIKL